MKCCLIVATINRVDPLPVLLNSIVPPVGLAVHVVVVDQNRDDRLASVLGAARGGDRFTLEHLRVAPEGVSAARTAGLACLHDADLVGFPDDDSFFDRQSLAQMVSVFSEYPEADAIIGSLNDPQSIDAQRSPAPQPRWESRIGLLRDSPTYAQFYRRATVEAIGAFDCTLGPGTPYPWGCGEDADYLVRAYDLRQRVLRAPSVRVYHPRIDLHRSPGYAAKAYAYGRGRMRLLAKHDYPHWFRLASIVHPLVVGLRHPATFPFRWHLFRGRWHELRHPYLPLSHEQQWR